MFLASPFLALALASFTPAAPATAPAAQTPVKMEDMFPMPKEGLTITVDHVGDKSMRLDALVDEFSRVTGITIQTVKDSQSNLRAVPIGLNRTIVVPPSEVYRIFETLLVANEFALIHLSDVEPRIWVVQSFTARGPQLRSNALYVAESDLGQWASHPATLITTTVNLPNTDVRTLSNSMRSMFTDANTQQIIPVGSTGLLVTGFAGNVNALVRMFRFIDGLESAQPRVTEPSAKPAPAAK